MPEAAARGGLPQVLPGESRGRCGAVRSCRSGRTVLSARMSSATVRKNSGAAGRALGGPVEPRRAGRAPESWAGSGLSSAAVAGSAGRSSGASGCRPAGRRRRAGARGRVRGRFTPPCRALSAVRTALRGDRASPRQPFLREAAVPTQGGQPSPGPPALREAVLVLRIGHRGEETAGAREVPRRAFEWPELAVTHRSPGRGAFPVAASRSATLLHPRSNSPFQAARHTVSAGPAGKSAHLLFPE